MHGIEVVGLRFENRCATKCSLIELALLMQSQGLLEPVRGIDLLIFKWHPLDSPLSEPTSATDWHFWQA
jgi:hypothetical protein